ncbi:MAG: AMP-binding protein [Pseudomonadales bacterium]
MARERSESILADIIAVRAERNPDFEVLTFECIEKADETRTYAQLFQHANALAAALIERGLEPGDRFGLFMRNHPEFVEAMIAASITGTVFVPIDARTRGAKLAYTLLNSGSKCVVGADYALAQLDEVRGELPGIHTVLALESGEDNAPKIDGFGSVEPIGPLIERSMATVDVRVRSPEDPLQIIYTSGTTGDPKGVVMQNGRYGGMAALGAGVFKFQPDERLYTGLSLTHGNAQAVTLAAALCLELPAVISRRFTKSRLWDICRKHGCTTFSLLGGMATAIYSEPLKADDGDNPVRMVTSAGMPHAIWESFETRFDLKVLEWYGAVEGGLAFKPIGEGPRGSFGKPGPGLDMLILDEQDNVCPPGVQGEVCSRPQGGGAVSVEYYKNPKASDEKTRGGWLRSGDIGHTDENGWLFFDYRKGGGIRRSGDFINPGFVEKVIAEHPAVSDVFVYGVEARSGAPGEKDVVAAVVPVPGETIDPQSLLDHCRAGLEGNFVPTYLQIVAEIPKTASEKPQERFLRERFDEVKEEVHDLEA